MIDPSRSLRRHPIRAFLRWAEDMIGLGRRCVERATEIQFLDRSVAIASTAFTALVPLLLIIGAVVPGTGGLADSLVRRFHLHGATATVVHQVFAPPNATKQALSIGGVFLLLISALSFTRSLTRVYEQSWRLPALGVRGTKGGLLWLLTLVIWATLFAAIRRAIVDATGPGVAVVVVLTGNFALWLATPTLLLSGRVPWRSLLPTAALTGTALTVLSAVSIIYMPHEIATAVNRYGPIGLAIALVSWLVILGFAVVISAAFGAEIFATGRRGLPLSRLSAMSDVPAPTEPTES
jgi:membrane protein